MARPDAPFPEELLNRRPPIWLAAYTLVLVIWLAGLYLPLYFSAFPHPIDSLDFSYYYAAARIGIEHGWDRIYDLGLQQQIFLQLHPTDVFDWKRYFVSPPPVAWLIAPFTLLPLVPAFWTFTGLSAAGFLAAGWLVVPGRGIARVALFLTVACTFPVLIAIQTGQVTPLIAAATVLAWWLAKRERQVLAGLVLVLLVLKPQVAILVPITMLIAGQKRLFVTWFIGAGAVTLVSVASLAGYGLLSLRDALSIEQGQGANLAWTMAALVGQGPLAIGLEVIGGGLALLLAYWHRRHGLEIVIVAGIVGTLVLAPYHNPSDFAVLAPATWLYLRTGLRPWHWAWLAFGLVATYVAAQFGPGPLLVFTIGWLGLLVADLRRTRTQDSPSPAGRVDAALGSR